MTKLSKNEKFILDGGDIVHNGIPNESSPANQDSETTATSSEIPKTTPEQNPPGNAIVRWILEDKDLSPEELRSVQLQATAISKVLYAKKDLLEEIVANGVRRAEREEIAEIGPPPKPYHETYSGLKLFFNELVPVGILIVILGVLVVIPLLGGVYGWGWLFYIGGGLVALTVICYVIYRVYKLWATTFRISDHEKLGFERKENLWLFINGYNPTVPAADYKQGSQWRSQFLRILHINAGHADLDSFAQDDGFLHNQKYVKDAERYKATAEANKDYALKIQGR